MKTMMKIYRIAPALAAAAAVVAYLFNRKKVNRKIAGWWEKTNPHLFPGDDILHGTSSDTPEMEKSI